MNRAFLAVCLWLLAWLLLDVVIIAAARTGLGWRKPALAAGVLAGGGFAAAVLINAGVDLW